MLTETSTMAELDDALRPETAALAVENATPPIIAGTTPFLELVAHFLRLWAIKILMGVGLALDRWLVHPPSAAIQPTLVKSYPCRPTLQHRIFFPPSWKPGARDKLSVYLDIHGGGFAFGDPELDDEFCSSWAARTGMLVVSLDYRKSPIHRYPTPVRDIAAVAEAVLDDDLLPIDQARVVMGGFSAGGTFALSASQLPQLKGRIKALIPYYPAVDFTTHPNEKFRQRLYTQRPTDSLHKYGPTFSWGYIPYWQDRRDPVLSPIFAHADDLPTWIMMICPQHDILTREARELICRLAGMETLSADEEVAWERGTYKWNLVEGTSHGFTHENGRGKRGRALRLLKKEEMYAAAHKWLESGPLA